MGTARPSTSPGPRQVVGHVRLERMTWRDSRVVEPGDFNGRSSPVLAAALNRQRVDCGPPLICGLIEPRGCRDRGGHHVYLSAEAALHPQPGRSVLRCDGYQDNGSPVVLRCHASCELGLAPGRQRFGIEADHRHPRYAWRAGAAVAVELRAPRDHEK